MFLALKVEAERADIESTEWPAAESLTLLPVQVSSSGYEPTCGATANRPPVAGHAAPHRDPPAAYCISDVAATAPG